MTLVLGGGGARLVEQEDAVLAHEDVLAADGTDDLLMFMLSVVVSSIIYKNRLR